MATRMQYETMEDPGRIGGGAFSKEEMVAVPQDGSLARRTATCPVMPVSVVSPAQGQAQIGRAQIGHTAAVGAGAGAGGGRTGVGGVGRTTPGEISAGGTGTEGTTLGGTGTGGTFPGGAGAGETSMGGTSVGVERTLLGGDRAVRRAEARRRRSNDRAIRNRLNVMDGEAGMATAEYAIATLAAVGFAALLVAVLSSGEVRGLLMSLITSALNFG